MLELKEALEVTQPSNFKIEKTGSGKSYDPVENPLVSQPEMLFLDHTPPVSFSLGAGDSGIA